MNFIISPIVQALGTTVVNNELNHEFLWIPNSEQEKQENGHLVLLDTDELLASCYLKKEYNT